VVFRDGAHGLLVWSLSIVLIATVSAPAGSRLAPHSLQSMGAQPAGSAEAGTANSQALTAGIDVMLRHADAPLTSG
jgi:hypothetical protein